MTIDGIISNHIPILRPCFKLFLKKMKKFVYDAMASLSLVQLASLHSQLLSVMAAKSYHYMNTKVVK